MKILVAEDNEDSRTLVLDILSMMGHEVAGAKNGQQALSLAQEETPEIDRDQEAHEEFDG